MAVAQRGTSQNYLYRAPSPGSGIVDVLDVILDKGLVIDAYVRVSLVGIELLTIDARIVIASVDTYLKFAEAVNRLDISSQGAGLPDLLDKGMESGAKDKTKGAVEGVKEAVKGNGRKQDDGGDEAQEQNEDGDSDS
jgi:gas vesicle structural protein